MLHIGAELIDDVRQHLQALEILLAGSRECVELARGPIDDRDGIGRRLKIRVQREIQERRFEMMKAAIRHELRGSEGRVARLFLLPTVFGRSREPYDLAHSSSHSS